MMARLLLLLSVVVLLSGCPHRAQIQSQASEPPLMAKVKQSRPVASFNRVYIDGKIDVTLHTGASKPHVIVTADPRDLPYVTTTVYNGSLHVTIGAGYPHFGRVNVEIFGHYLNDFEYHGAGVIKARGLRTSLLDLLLDNQGETRLQGNIGLHQLKVMGSGYTEIRGIQSAGLLISLSGKAKVRLAGVVNISHLDLNKDSWLSLYWVKSRLLTIRARDNSKLQLAGVADKLDVELWGTAQFKGRYLRAERAFVKTHDKSVAEISAVKRQHTLARDASDIQFFNIPVMKADFMANDGAVLDMRDLSLPFIQEYNQYNK